jgi:hypothetical protein
MIAAAIERRDSEKMGRSGGEKGEWDSKNLVMRSEGGEFRIAAVSTKGEGVGFWRLEDRMWRGRTCSR